MESQSRGLAIKYREHAADSASPQPLGLSLIFSLLSRGDLSPCSSTHLHSS